MLVKFWKFYLKNVKLQFQESGRVSLRFNERKIYLSCHTLGSAVPQPEAAIYLALPPNEGPHHYPSEEPVLCHAGMSLYHGDMLNLSHFWAQDVPSCSLKILHLCSLPLCISSSLSWLSVCFFWGHDSYERQDPCAQGACSLVERRKIKLASNSSGFQILMYALENTKWEKQN